MAENEKPSNQDQLPLHTPEPLKKSYIQDSIDDAAEVMFNSALSVPPGKVVTESYKDPNDPSNQ
ncbi:MAG: hypothetical protein E7E41_20180 [Klebsiella oxytoca]|uniref:hypothetical protein n=1 Tax=Klebsiella oxytoca TaxID=571 RepID=UPI002236B799|nr:hypothetical protein [Klebsiella oxytoca]EKW2360056.1 hypothetical protein [Klebsiella oxytoca]EKW2421561.1 hypothetical protein [Klebsiella oxytoca]ELX8408476.1 hypothetical protein [Klebsiella oxytoca]MCW4551924.1 hypothetical protein [Klebsiella oxytoca]MCW4565990.1 hypothetical protein [Klebsiella oxytoca]